MLVLVERIDDTLGGCKEVKSGSYANGALGAWMRSLIVVLVGLAPLG